MPDKFTAQHNPPIESVLLRALFVGSNAAPLWDVRRNFTEEGALPDASFCVMLVGVNAMVYHHSTSENEKGQKSVVCTIPGSPLVLVCDADAIQAKPFGQQMQDHYTTIMRKEGVGPCIDCHGTGKNLTALAAGDDQPMCLTCEGRGFVPVKRPEAGPDVAIPGVKTEPLQTDPQRIANEKIDRMVKETGKKADECIQALTINFWDVEKALEWIDRRAGH